MRITRRKITIKPEQITLQEDVIEDTLFDERKSVPLLGKKRNKKLKSNENPEYDSGWSNLKTDRG